MTGPNVRKISDNLIVADARTTSGAEFFRAIFHPKPSELERLRAEIGAKLMAGIREQQAKNGGQS